MMENSKQAQNEDEKPLKTDLPTFYHLSYFQADSEIHLLLQTNKVKKPKC